MARTEEEDSNNTCHPLFTNHVFFLRTHLLLLLLFYVNFNRDGTVGRLTNGVIDRTEYYRHALAMALIPFLNSAGEATGMLKEKTSAGGKHEKEEEENRLARGNKLMDDKNKSTVDEDNNCGSTTEVRRAKRPRLTW